MTTHDLFLDLEQTYKIENFSAEGDFSERLITLSQRLSEEYKSRYGTQAAQRLTTNDVTELLHTHDIRQLCEKISKYLEHKGSVWILFDNLDKGWSTRGVDVIDAIALRCLIDAGRKVEREMRRSNHLFRCVVFIRNDVYEHVMVTSADYGKEMRAVLDWTDADLLREMLHLRLVSVLADDDADSTFERLWPKVVTSHFSGEETFAYIIERSLMRPRNVLKIFSHSRGFAIHLGNHKISEADVEKSIRAYSQDLLIELDRELTDIFPAAASLLYYFIDSPCALNTDELTVILKEGCIEDHLVLDVILFLLYYGVLGVRADGVTNYIYNVNYDLRVLQIRANRAGIEASYIINPAFWPALSVRTDDKVQ